MILVMSSLSFFILINTCQTDAIPLMLNMRWLKKQLLMIGLVFEQQNMFLPFVCVNIPHTSNYQTHSFCYLSKIDKWQNFGNFIKSSNTSNISCNVTVHFSGCCHLSTTHFVGDITASEYACRTRGIRSHAEYTDRSFTINSTIRASATAK